MIASYIGRIQGPDIKDLASVEMSASDDIVNYRFESSGVSKCEFVLVFMIEKSVVNSQLIKRAKVNH